MNCSAPQDDLLCGFHALLLSIQARHPHTAPLTVQNLQDVAARLKINAQDDFASDELSRILRGWCRDVGENLHLGYVERGSQRPEYRLGGQPGANDNDARFVWIENDNAAQVADSDSTYNHWSGLRRQIRPPA